MQTMKPCLTAIFAIALLAGCGKKDETPSTEPPPPKTAKSPAKPTAKPPTDAVTIPATGNQPPPTAPGTTTQELTQYKTFPQPKPTRVTDPAQRAQLLETSYIANPDFSQRVQIIYKLSDIGTPESLASLGRIFHMEKDPDLKVEVLDSLFDFDGQDQNKAALLAQGAGPDQPKDVRESAIDGLTDIEAKIALPILQALANDPDAEVRDLVRDALEQVQAELAADK
jgi:hypothetical protein